jgi:hypothetical protein
MTNSILVQAKKFDNAVDDYMKYVDIDYEVCNPRKTASSSPWTTSTRTTIMRNERAIANAFRIWLQSSKNDYIRNPGFGGFFDNNMNDRFPFDPSSEQGIEQALIAASALRWPDIEILDVEVKCVKERRSWKVRVAIMDKNSGMIAPVEDVDTEISADR